MAKATKAVRREAIREEAKRIVRPAAAAVLVAHRQKEEHQPTPTKKGREVAKTEKVREAGKRYSAARQATKAGVKLHPAEERRVEKARQLSSAPSRGRGRPRTRPLPSGRGRGRPKSQATLEREKKIASGYVPRRGRPAGSTKPKPEPVKAKPSKIPTLRKGHSLTPEQAVKAHVTNKNGMGAVVKEGKAAGEFGQHHRGKTLVSYQDKTAQAQKHGVKSTGSMYKYQRRSFTFTKKGQKHAVDVVKTKKQEGNKWQNFHSTRNHRTPDVHRTEHIRHNADDPQRSKKTRMVISRGGMDVQTASGRTSKTWYKGFMGHSLPASRVSEPSSLTSSVAKGLPNRSKVSPKARRK